MSKHDTPVMHDFILSGHKSGSSLLNFKLGKRLKILGFLHRVVPVQVRPGAPLSKISHTYLRKSGSLLSPLILPKRQTKPKISNCVTQGRHTLAHSQFHATAFITFLKSPVSTSPEFGGVHAIF